MSPSVAHLRAVQPLATSSTPGGVLVELAGPRGKRERLGSAREALRDRRLTRAERDAIEALVRAVELLRSRAQLAGIDDAGTAVRLILRDSDATARGPWATIGQVAVGSRNALVSHVKGRAREDVLLPVDTALHELAHVVQFAIIPEGVEPHAAILEGVADSVAILATGDDTLGEGFYRTDAQGRYVGSLRELGGRAPNVSGSPLGPIVQRYTDATRKGVEEHAAGGLVSATMLQIRAYLGRDATERLLWAVIRDTQAWSTGGSWHDLALALRRQVAAIHPGDANALAAVNAALATTGLDAALAAAA